MSSNIRMAALFMILLIIMLPVYSAQAFAASLTITSIKGEQGLSNFRKKIDTTVMDVEATLEGDTALTGNQLRTYINGNGPFVVFPSCTGAAGNFRCRSAGSNILPGGRYSYEVKLYDDRANYLTSAKADIIVDDARPAITRFAIEPSLGTSTTVNVSYGVVDSAYASSTQDCVGIKKIEFYENDFGGKKLKEIPVTIDTCKVEDMTTLTAPSSNGVFKVCAKAYDKFDQPSSGLICQSFAVDQSVPTIQSAALVDLAGKKIEHIGTNIIGASLIINITDNDLVEDTVKADLTELELFPDTPRSSCQKVSATVTRCLWNFNLILYDTKTPQIPVTATDRAGNVMNAVASLSTITRDVQGPTMTLSISSGSFGGTNVIGNKFNITAQVQDIVGVSQGNVFLDLSGLGLGNNVRADKCTRDLCIWSINGISAASKATVNISSTLSTKDDLGNKATQIASVSALVDLDDPAINSLEINVTQGQVPLPPGFAIKGDKLVIRANVTENSSLAANLVTTIFGNIGPLAGSCERADKEYICSWETPAIETSGPFLAKLFFSFTDFSGNAKGITKDLFISRADDDPEPNFYTSSVSCTPSFIDRQISEKINVREYCHVTLSPQGVDAIPLITQLEQCQGDGFGFVNDVIPSNLAAGSKHPVLTVVLNTVNFADTNLFNITCDLSIISTIGGDTVNIFPEMEQVAIKIPVTNFPLGEASEQLERDLQDAIDDATGPFWETIGILKMIFEYARKLCYLYSAISNFINIWQQFTFIIEHATTLAKAIPPAAPAAEAARQSSLYSLEGFKQTSSTSLLPILDKFCLFLNCQLGPQAPGMADDPNKRSDKIGAGDVLGFLGGGGGFGLQPRKWGNTPFLSPNWFEDWTGRPVESYLNGRDSIIIALLTLCIPGIIYGIDRYRQINCMYALCLGSSIDSNVPPEVCEKQKDYLTCKYVVGEIFNAIPFTAFFNYYIEIIKAALADPLQLVGIVLGWFCAPTISTVPYAYYWCSIPSVISNIGQAIQDVTAIVDMNFWKVQTDYCGQVQELKDKLDDEDEEE